MSKQFNERLQQIRSSHAALLATKNEEASYNGLFTRYTHPVLTAAHVPLEWRYDCNPNTNPFLMERFGLLMNLQIIVIITTLKVMKKN